MVVRLARWELTGSAASKIMPLIMQQVLAVAPGLSCVWIGTAINPSVQGDTRNCTACSTRAQVCITVTRLKTAATLQSFSCTPTPRSPHTSVCSPSLNAGAPPVDLLSLVCQMRLKCTSTLCSRCS